MHDLLIIGGGPAGVTGAVYAAHKKLKTVLVAGEFGGQSAVSPDIHNWIGTPSISGADLAKSFERHVREYEGDTLAIKLGSYATRLSKTEGGFSLETNKGDHIEARAVLIASGSNRRKLDIPGAAEFEHKGLTYCATCDGPLFSDMDVAVVGGGNAGFETAAQLAAYCKSVTVLHRGKDFKADSITVEAVRKLPNVSLMTETEPSEVMGEKFVSGLRYKKSNSAKESVEGELSVQGIFVEIGSIPSTEYANNLVEMTEFGHIIVDPWVQSTSEEGIWAAGDVTNAPYHQNNIASGDAVKAIENLYIWLQKKK